MAEMVRPQRQSTMGNNPGISRESPDSKCGRKYGNPQFLFVTGRGRIKGREIIYRVKNCATLPSQAPFPSILSSSDSHTLIIRMDDRVRKSGIPTPSSTRAPCYQH